jgi:hypothetical protein
MEETRTAALQQSSGPATGSVEGRCAPRLQVLGQIQGHIAGLGAPAIVTEIGIDGFRIDTIVDIPSGSVHELQFTLGDGSVVYARAKALHSRRESGLDGGLRLYSCGFVFVEEAWRGRSTSDLIDHMMSTLTFDLG